MKTEDDHPSADFIAALPSANSAEPEDSRIDHSTTPSSGPPPPPTAASASESASHRLSSGSPTKPHLQQQQQQQHQINKRTVCDHCRRRRMCDPVSHLLLAVTPAFCCLASPLRGPLTHSFPCHVLDVKILALPWCGFLYCLVPNQPPPGCPHQHCSSHNIA